MIIIPKTAYPKFVEKFIEFIEENKLNLRVELTNDEIVIHDKCKINSDITIYGVDDLTKLKAFDLSLAPLAIVWKAERTEYRVYVYKEHCEFETLVLEKLC